MALKSGISLKDGETLVMELEAELWAASSSPVAKLLGGFYKLIAKILGFKIKGFLVVTDQRVIEVSEQMACYCVTTGRQIKYILPSSVKEIGYTKAKVCGLFCEAFFLYYEGLTQRTSIMLKDADENAAAKAATAFYAAISHAKA